VKQAVIDASVAIKWAVPEAHSDNAASLLAEGTGLSAPGHWAAEVATALWAKSAIHGVLSRQQAIERMAWIESLMVEVVPVDRLIVAAMGIAFDLHATAYDTLYLALAEQSGAALVTADRKLYEKAKASSRFSDLIVWVGDLSLGSAG
jgi:predicted nucleic acid-binding protein